MAVSGWTRHRLGDIVEIKHGWPFKSEFFAEDLTGLPIVVGVGNFRYTGGFRFEDTLVKEYRGNYPKEYELAAGDILLVMTCQTAGGEILGIPARVPTDGRLYLHNQRLGRVVIRDKAHVDRDFLYWRFLSPDFNRELVASASGTKILHTAPSRIEAFRFDLPPRAEQRAIAQVLSTLDDKIELNRRMIETLEGMARALFKSWFVDFEPVREKSEGREPGLPKPLADLFPGAFENSAIGEIPKGWAMHPLGDIADLEKGLSYKGEGLVREGGLPLINLGCFGVGGRFRAQNIKRYSGEYRQRHVVRAGDLVIANTDVTQNRVIIGSPALLPTLSGERDYLFSHHTFAVRFKPECERSKLFLYFALLQPGFREIAEGYATGTTVLALPRDGVLGFRLAMPPGELLAAFDSQVRTLLLRAEEAARINDTLSAVRDELVPKLVSGELRIRNADHLARVLA